MRQKVVLLTIFTFVFLVGHAISMPNGCQRMDHSEAVYIQWQSVR